MNKWINTAFLSLLCCCTSSIAVGQYQLKGQLLDAQTGEAIVGGYIIDSLEQETFLSTEGGAFTIVFPDTSARLLQVRALGYQTQQLTYRPQQKDDWLSVELHPLSLDEVEVSARRITPVAAKLGLSREQIKNLPALGGEPDLMKALSIFPGVSNSSEGSAQILVRGGDNGQNLLLWEGIPLYNPNHLGGFVSAFHPDALESANLYKGGFPAEYGGRLASVLDLTARQGNKDSIEGNFRIGTLSSGLALNGPLLKDKRLRFSLSARAAYPGLLTLPLYPFFKGGTLENIFSYGFYDTQAELSYQLNSKHLLGLSFYHHQDKFDQRDQMVWGFPEWGSERLQNFLQLGWGNTALGLKHHWQAQEQLSWSNKLSYSTYRYGILHRSVHRHMGYANSTRNRIHSDEKLQSSYSLQNIHWRSQGKWSPNAYSQWQFGLEAQYEQFGPYQALEQRWEDESLHSERTVEEGYRYQLPQIALFVAGQQQLGPLEVQYGLRYSTAWASGQRYQLLEPRLALLWSASQRLKLRATTTRMGQYSHLLSSNPLGFPNDTWVPVTESVGPQQAWQYSLGAVWQKEKHWRVELEGYYKHSSGLLDYQSPTDGLLFGANGNWEDRLARNGRGESKGVELLIEKQQGAFTSSLAYTLAWANRRFPSIQDGQAFPFLFDRRHQLTWTGNWKINEHWRFSFLWNYQSGQAIHLPIGRVPGENYFVYGARNNARMPDFHRLDIGLQHEKQTKRGNRRYWRFDITNVYNRQNPFALKIRPRNYDRTGQSGYELRQTSLFPILPSISYGLDF